ncbi:MAG: preprotein translocase subunit YajC [Gammaproteobacteria bacterium]|nr:preprotein translocase subunit YajC [Gammaproteobacteria bacterium]
MDFFIANAYAEGAAPGGGDLFGMLLPILLLVVFFFLFIRPQQKRAKEHKAMLEALNKGDEVVSTGGLAGTILEVGDSFILLQVADNTQVKVQKSAIGALLPKGSLKNL